MIEHKPRVYLDTSVISSLFDEQNPERQLLTEGFFRESRNFSIFVSELTMVEIEHTLQRDLRDAMLRTVSLYSVLPLGNDIDWLAKQYLHHHAIPDTYAEDAYHIAIAVLNDIDYLVSWSFKHIVRRKTKDIVRMVNSINDLKHIEIMTPAELL